MERKEKRQRKTGTSEHQDITLLTYSSERERERGKENKALVYGEKRKTGASEHHDITL